MYNVPARTILFDKHSKGHTMEQPISRVRRALDPFRRTDLRKSKRTAAVAGIVVPLIWVGGAIVCLAYLEAAIAVPTATLLFASLLLRIGNMLHEAAHSTFTRYKPLNDLAGEVFAVITLNCFPTYRYEHGTHHLHLGNYVLDCDFNALAKLGYEQAIHSIWTIFWWFLKTLNPTQFAKTYLPKTFWWTEASAREKTFR